MPAGKKSSKKKSSSRKSAAAMVVPGYTRSSGGYMRYSPSGPEAKWIDLNVGPAVLTPGYGTAVTGLANIAQGAGASQRIGRSVLVKSIDVKINLKAFWQPSGANVSVQAISYRVDLLLDKQTNGAYPVNTDIYDSAIATVDACNRFDNLYNSDRFVRLKRWEGDINPSGFSTGVGSVLSVDRDLKCSKKLNVRMEFSGATGAIAEIRSNNLLLVYSASLGTGPVNSSLELTTADSRVRFIDT